MRRLRTLALTASSRDRILLLESSLDRTDVAASRSDRIPLPESNLGRIADNAVRSFRTNGGKLPFIQNDLIAAVGMAYLGKGMIPGPMIGSTSAVVGAAEARRFRPACITMDDANVQLIATVGEAPISVLTP